MKPVLWSCLAAAALTLACGRDARNDTTNPAANDAAIGTSGVARDISDSDRDFVADLLEVGTAEVQLGTMASERGARADVKQFGQMMVQDHTRAGEELRQIAARYQIPRQGAALDEHHRDLIDRLSKLHGPEFDREYMDAMVQGHQAVIDKLQSRVDERDRFAVATGQAERNTNVKPEDADNRVDASLNEWAAETLPVAKEHLDRAKAIDGKLDRSKAGS